MLRPMLQKISRVFGAGIINQVDHEIATFLIQQAFKSLIDVIEMPVERQNHIHRNRNCGEPFSTF